MVEVFPAHHKEVFSPQLFLSPKPPPPVPIQLLVPSPLYSPSLPCPVALARARTQQGSACPSTPGLAVQRSGVQCDVRCSGTEGVDIIIIINIISSV